MDRAPSTMQRFSRESLSSVRKKGLQRFSPLSDLMLVTSLPSNEP
jgi:hypothetical protein